MAGEEGIWERGWADHDRGQLIRLAKLPLPQKLQWLEEAHRLVRHLATTERVIHASEDDPSSVE